MIRQILAVAVLGLVPCACTRVPIAPATDPFARPHESVGYISGTARVLTIDKSLGQATLEFDGQGVNAYWLTETDVAQGGTVTTVDPLQPDVGSYEKPVVRAEVFNAVPGDTIQFAGLKTGDDILLRGFRVIGHQK